MSKLLVSADVASRIHDWLTKRGGVAVWESINLSNPGAEFLTPADSKRPNWQVANKPARVVTDINNVTVTVLRQVRRFHVSVRVKEMALVVSDGGTRRIRRELAKHKDATYQFDFDSFDNVVILVPEATIPLNEYLKTHAK